MSRFAFNRKVVSSFCFGVDDPSIKSPVVCQSRLASLREEGGTSVNVMETHYRHFCSYLRVCLSSDPKYKGSLPPSLTFSASKGLLQILVVHRRKNHDDFISHQRKETGSHNPSLFMTFMISSF